MASNKQQSTSKETLEFTQDLFNFIWAQQKFFSTEVEEKFKEYYRPRLSSLKKNKTGNNFTEDIGKAVRVSQFLLREYFKEFFHFIPSKDSFKRDVKVIWTCWLDNRSNIFVKVLDTLAIIAEAFLFCDFMEEYRLDLSEAVQWFMEWFEESLVSEFFESGGWKKLNEQAVGWYAELFKYLNMRVKKFSLLKYWKMMYDCQVVDCLRYSPVMFPVPQEALCKSCQQSSDKDNYQMIVFMRTLSEFKDAKEFKNWDIQTGFTSSPDKINFETLFKSEALGVDKQPASKPFKSEKLYATKYTSPGEQMDVDPVPIDIPEEKVSDDTLTATNSDFSALSYKASSTDCSSIESNKFVEDSCKEALKCPQRELMPTTAELSDSNLALSSKPLEQVLHRSKIKNSVTTKSSNKSKGSPVSKVSSQTESSKGSLVSKVSSPTQYTEGSPVSKESSPIKSAKRTAKIPTPIKSKKSEQKVSEQKAAEQKVSKQSKFTTSNKNSSSSVKKATRNSESMNDKNRKNTARNLNLTSRTSEPSIIPILKQDSKTIQTAGESHDPTSTDITSKCFDNVKDLLNKKSPKDGSTEKSPKDGSTEKSPKDGSTEKSPKEGSTEKSPKEGSTEKSPKEGLSKISLKVDQSENRSPKKEPKLYYAKVVSPGPEMCDDYTPVVQKITMVGVEDSIVRDQVNLISEKYSNSFDLMIKDLFKGEEPKSLSSIHYSMSGITKEEISDVESEVQLIHCEYPCYFIGNEDGKNKRNHIRRSKTFTVVGRSG